MRSVGVAYVIVIVLAIGAAVAIAGVPGGFASEDELVATSPFVSSPALGSLPPPLTQAAETSIATTTSTPAATTIPIATTTTTTSPVSTTTTSMTTTVPDPPPVLRERSALSVATANATDQSGVAAAHADELEGLGYVDVAPVDSAVSQTSAVYYQPGLELEAARLAIDLGWDPLAMAPMSEVPSLQTESTFGIVAVVGLDRT